MSSRLLVLTGPLFAVAFYVAVLFMEQDTPEESASGKAVVDYYNAHGGSTLVGVYTWGSLLATVGFTVLMGHNIERKTLPQFGLTWPPRIRSRGRSPA